MKTLNEMRDEVAEMFPGQSVCVSAAAWCHVHDTGPNRITNFTVSVHAKVGKHIPFHETFSDPELALAAVRSYRTGEWDPKAKDREVVAIGECDDDCAKGGPENCTGCMD